MTTRRYAGVVEARSPLTGRIRQRDTAERSRADIYRPGPPACKTIRSAAVSQCVNVILNDGYKCSEIGFQTGHWTTGVGIAIVLLHVRDYT